MPIEEPKGDLSIFGGRQQEHESDSSLDEAEATQEQDPEVQQAEAEWEQGDAVYQAGPPEMDISVEDSKEESEEELEGDEYDQMLARAHGSGEEVATETVPGDVQMQERLAYQQGRLEALEEQIKDRTETPATPEPEARPGINYQDPAIQAALKAAVDDPEKLGPTIAVLVRKEAEALIESEVGQVKDQLAEVKAKEEDTQQRQEVGAKITAGLQAAHQMGGLEAAIVKEAWSNQGNSMLYQYLNNGNQALATTPQGILTAVLAVARAVERADANRSEEPAEETQETPALSSKKRSTSQSKRGRNLRKPNQKLTPEEDIKARIVATKPQRSQIPFMR